MKFFLAFIFISSTAFAQQVDTFNVVKQTEAQKKFEPLVATFAHRSGGKISATEASVGCCVMLNRDDVQVNSFTVSISDKGEWLAYEMIGNHLNSEATKNLRGLKPGDKFVIENIVAFGDDGLRRSVSPLIFTIE